MELHSLLLFGCYVILLQNRVFSEKTLIKRAIPSAPSTPKRDEVEGSGATPSLTEKQKSEAGADTEWEASGISPDDEDGDVVEGSGAHIDDVSGGSGSMPMTSAPSYTRNITITTTLYPPFDVNIHETERRPEEDVAIEEMPTSTTVQSWTTTSRRPPPTSLTTEQSPPPEVFDEKRNIPFDALLKPGVLAAVIGGVVVAILAAILLVMFVVYRMRKKDEGSYALDEPKQQPPHFPYAYQKAPPKEFYA